MRRQAFVLAALAAATVLPACSDSPSGPAQGGDCQGAATHGTIAVGQTRTGTLSQNSCTLPHDGRAHGYALTLAARTSLRIEMTSTQLDALLFVATPQLDLIAYDDDSGTGLNSLLFTTLDAGTYVIWASTFEGETGTYSLSVQAAQTASCTVPGSSIVVGQTVQGTLATGDCPMESGALADLWGFTTAVPVTVQVDLRSNDFDSYLWVSAGSQFIASDDDGGDGVDSRLVLALGPGSYVFWASSFFPGERGAYQLSVTQAAGAGLTALPEPFGASVAKPQRDERRFDPASGWRMH